jgi:3-(methylthio)propanoyl-CoA dehydrogenase
VRITTIYEGTTGIQANDLIGRKLARDRGAAMASLIEEMSRELEGLAATEDLVDGTCRLAFAAVGELRRASQSLGKALATRPELALAVSVPYLKLCGYVAGGWLLARSAAIAEAKLEGAEREFYQAKVQTAAFYAAHVLPLAGALARIVEAGGASVADLDAALI